MIDDKLERILYELGLDLNLIGGIATVVAYSPPMWYHSYYHFMAISFVFLFTGWVLIARRASDFKKDIAMFFAVASLNNIADEINGTATIFNWTEYISAGVYLAYLIFKYIRRLIKWWKKRKRKNIIL